MSNIVTYPLNGIDYDAADAAGHTATRTSGVYSSEEDFAVTAAGGLSVTVSAGVGWVHPARFEGYSVIMREAETLTLALADGQRPRIDRIVLRYDAAAHKSSLRVLQGTPDTQPTAPGISRTALLYDLCLAQITRPAGSTTIVAGHITDTRLDPALCGVMRDGVTGIPTEELIASARERINALEETASAAAKEADASKTAAAQSEANAEAYKEAAATSESNAAGSASASAGSAAAAAQSENAAAGSAAAAAGSASVAEKSKTAAATSESNAAKHEEAAKKASDEAGAKAGTDKTLSIENAPADAAAVRKLIEESLAAQRAEDYARIKFWASNDPTSPASFIGGTWERVEGEFIMGASSAYPVGTTGGSATHTQTTAEMPSHSHSGSTGSSGSHSHSASTDSAGWHSHSGTTDWAGSHTHDATINSNGSSTGGNSGLVSSSMAYGDSYHKATITTKSAGSHTHSFSTNGTGSHSHTVSIGDAGAHSHTVSIGSTGSGQAMDILNPYYALYIWVRVDDAA